MALNTYEEEAYSPIEDINDFDDYLTRKEQLEEQGYVCDEIVPFDDLNDELEVYCAQRVFRYVVLPQFDEEGEKSDEYVEVWVPFDNKDF